jgi:hypothetical protein
VIFWRWGIYFVDPRARVVTCGYEFNETQSGWDECTEKVGHKGDHYDDTSKHSCPNTGPLREPR